MDKKAIKEFAVNARKELIEEVTTKLNRLGITDKGIEEAKEIDQSLQEIESTHVRLTGNEITQRGRLIEKLEQKSSTSDYKEEYQSLIEEVAYTWFNRLIAIRFMEVNDYLPDSYRVLSSENTGKIEPDIITDIYDSDIYEELSTSEKQQVNEWKMDNSAEAMDKLYQFVFIKICHQLNDYLPELFEQVEDYTELLFTASYIKKDGVIAKLLSIPEENFDVSQGGQVEIIGWLYQYYNSEPHDLVVNIYKGIVKKQDIPAATQLFTTDWVVRYMVDNSLGKYWLDHYPGSELKNKLTYLIPTQEVTKETDPISNLKPEDLKVMDNAMGSGHILVYAFDVLMEIYLSLGYSERDAARSIVQYNLYGLEIDKRAYQLAYFAIMMKGRQYDRLFLKKNISPSLKEFIDSPKVTDDYKNRMIELHGESNTNKWDEYQELVFDRFLNAKELGSIIKLTDYNDKLITKDYIKEIREYLLVLDQFTNMDILYGLKDLHESYLSILDVAELMIEKYSAVITNPPYLNKMDTLLKKYVNTHYPDVKKDLFSVFIYLNSQMIKKDGYASFMTPFVWMFISSYEKLRSFLINNRHLSSLIQMEYSAFEEATVPICTFTIKNSKETVGSYIKLSDFTGGMEVQKIKTLEALNDTDSCDYFYHTDQNNFKKIPGMPIAYWASDALIKDFEIGEPISNYVTPKQGLATADNNRFLRLWWEVDFNKIKFDATSLEDAKLSNKKWFPYNKGGSFRRWYGNYDYIVNWENDGEEIRNFCDSKGKVRSRPQNTNYYFKESITWPLITSGGLSVRYREYGSIHDVSGMSAFSNKTENIFYCLGILNSPIGNNILKLLNPTINSQVGDFEKIPIIYDDKVKSLTIDKVKKCINLSKLDWDSEEISWDFKRINLRGNKILDYIVNESHLKDTHIEELRKNHESINHNFLTLYDLDNDYSSVVEDKDIPITKLNKLETIKNFISYSIGVMFGRYSLDEEGLIFAGGQWDDSRYTSFKPDKDNVLLITDDEYFKDSQIDIVNRFIEFVKVTFGSDTLEENLQFIADTLGGKGKSREVIRRYFVKDFYKDHLKTYSNRPIYWQLDSGKQNGFKALMYLHRYTPDQLGKVRTEYLHELQKAYDNRIEWREQQIAASDNQKDINKWSKDMTKIQKQLKELRDYDEKLGHLALNRIELDLDDGVIVNYDKLQRDTDTGEKFQILSKGVKEPKK